MRIKRVILRVSVFLLLFVLVATVLSRTIYRLLLPQVSVAAVLTGSLNNALTYRTSVGLPVPGDTAEAPAVTYEFTADVAVSFDELKKLLSAEYRTSANAEPLVGETVIPVDIALVGYDYDMGSGRYLAHFNVSSDNEALETGLPLTITVNTTKSEGSRLVPLNSVFTDMSAGIPQYCVFEVSEKKTIWGTETVVNKLLVTVSGSDYQYTAITFAGMGAKQVACYPSRPLNDGETVTVLGS